MLTRRLFAAGLAAGVLAAPGLPAAQQQQPQQASERRRRTADPEVTMPEPGRRDWAQRMPQLRVGLLGGENEADRLARHDAYKSLLEETFKIPVRLFPASDYAGVLQTFSAKQIEMAGLGASGYAGAWLDTNGGIEPIVVPEEADGSTAYVSVMVVRADSSIRSLPDMKGKSLAWADPNSTLGYLIPRFALRRQGINPEGGEFFSRTGFAGGHEQGVVAVLQRQYDGAVTWASGQGDPDKGFTRGNLRAMVDKGMLKMSDLRIVWTSDPIPNGPSAVRNDLPASFKKDMTDFHLALPKTRPKVYEQIERGGGTGYREAKHSDYALIVDLRREEAQQRRRRQ